MPEIIIIAAIDENNGLGFENHLLCHLHDDLKNFKRLTSGHTVVMGRKTWESLPVKPLPNRKNIILTRDADATFLNGFSSKSLNHLQEICSNDDEIFIIGGATIYQQAMDIADKLIITHIHHRFKADVFFPEINKELWLKINETVHPIDEKHNYAFDICEYVRVLK
jgi:dihydrofolate reductase